MKRMTTTPTTVSASSVTSENIGAQLTVTSPLGTYSGLLIEALRTPSFRTFRLHTEDAGDIVVTVPSSTTVQVTPHPPIEVGMRVTRSRYFDRDSVHYRVAAFGRVTKIGRDAEQRRVYLVTYDDQLQQWCTRRALQPLTPAIIADAAANAALMPVL
jgi:hypothetical protein